MRLATLIGLNANGEGNASMLDNNNNPSTAVPIPAKQAARTRFARRSEPARNVPHNTASPALEASATKSQVLNGAPKRRPPSDDSADADNLRCIKAQFEVQRVF